MNGRLSAFAVALALAALLVAPWSAPASAAEKAEEIKQGISSAEEKAAQSKKELQQLDEQERKLRADIAALEDRIKAREKTVAGREDELTAREAELAGISERRKGLEAEAEAARSELAKLLAGLWPLRLSDVQERLAGSGGWQEADRRFTWLSAVYAQADAAAARLAEKSAALAAVEDKERSAAEAARAGLAGVNSEKDALLADKLALQRRIQEVRKGIADEEQELKGVLATVESLKYKLKSLTPKKFAELKGALPWPAKGKLVAGFAPEASPPCRGIGISLQDGTPVTAVSGGKVVHEDRLRGFGEVVILFHGDDYYTLYAFLAESSVRLGQEIEQGQSIGKAGFYPAAKGPGLYFELRSGPKPINPKAWLAGS